MIHSYKQDLEKRFGIKAKNSTLSKDLKVENGWLAKGMECLVVSDRDFIKCFNKMKGPLKLVLLKALWYRGVPIISESRNDN